MTSQSDYEAKVEAARVASSDLLQRDWFAQQQPLLLHRQPIILFPSVINDGTFFEMSWAIEHARAVHTNDLPIYVRISGAGGITREMFSIVDLFRLDNNLVGLLYGENYSAHTSIWASCRHRFVLPNASFNIHGVSQETYFARESRVSKQHDLTLMDFLDRRIAKIYADACDADEYDEDYWYTQLGSVPASSTKLITADDLVNVYKMGRMVE